MAYGGTPALNTRSKTQQISMMNDNAPGYSLYNASTVRGDLNSSFGNHDDRQHSFIGSTPRTEGEDSSEEDGRASTPMNSSRSDQGNTVVPKNIARIREQSTRRYSDSTTLNKLPLHSHFARKLVKAQELDLTCTDDEQPGIEDIRSGIHRCLYLSLEKPLFKKGCAMKFLDSSMSLSPLMNVHIGLRNSGLKGSNKKVGFVNGSYEYYHYMQMGMNDSGWGCAYRSLQTIVSWFILQGYTTKQIPNHKRIQEILVEIGDKEQKFLGSKTWIGSTEVAYVLECYLINISSIIINVPSGSEMYTMAPVLFDHFTFHGTPVMIGGGVAAHTIIGIDYNEDTSEVKFLILDPHYIGDDDLTTIQKKGAVGWKGMEFWDQKAFYNLCFPQRPICI